MKPIQDKRNINILIYLRALKYLNKAEFNDLREEIEESIQSGIKYLTRSIKEL
jgi:hypothetical protein